MSMMPYKPKEYAPWCTIHACNNPPYLSIKDYHKVLGGVVLLLCKEHYTEHFGDDMSFKVKEIFEHEGRTCVVVETRLSGFSHNGYVSLLGFHKNMSYGEIISEIDTNELTFSGFLERYSDEGKAYPDYTWFVGFDASHAWNDEEPESKTFESVRARTVQLAEELIKKGY